LLVITQDKKEQAEAQLAGLAQKRQELDAKLGNQHTDEDKLMDNDEDGLKA
jgi:hypothetical protein